MNKKKFNKKQQQQHTNERMCANIKRDLIRTNS